MKPIKVRPRRLLTTLAILSLALVGMAAHAPSAPTEGHAAAGRVAHVPSASPKKPAPPPAPLIDINSASRAELKTLPGIGEPEAARIVAGRPYLSKAELVTKDVLPTGPYLSLKHQIIAMQSTPPRTPH